MSAEVDKISFKSTEDDSPNSNNIASAELKGKFRKIGVLGGPQKKQSTLNLLTLESKTSSIKKMEPFHKYLIYWTFKQSSNETVMEIQLELPDSYIVSDAIKYALELFNEKLAADKIKDISLHPEFSSFELSFAKKNGKPKTDLPALDYNQVLSMAGSKTFTLSEKHDFSIIKRNNSKIRKSITISEVPNDSPVSLKHKSSKSSKTTKVSDSQGEDESPIIVERSNSSVIAKSIFNNSLINSVDRRPSSNSIIGEKKSQKGCNSILTIFSLCSRPTCNI